MILYPAIDIYEGKVVRLYKGAFDKMTVYSNDPTEIAKNFTDCGCDHIHIVDLEGAKSGTTPNLEVICMIKETTGAFCEVGGGIRSFDVAKAYIDAGLDRIIIGTAAVTDPGFLKELISSFGEKTAVGIDSRNGMVAIKGWQEESAKTTIDFCKELIEFGITTVICTDIAKDGVMEGPNFKMYEELIENTSLNIIASGGVSSTDDLVALNKCGVYGAIIGKAYYEGAIDLRKAVALTEV